MKRIFAILSLIVVFFSGPNAWADWHGGRVNNVSIAYDGNTVTFTVVGHSRSNCTCYPPWAGNMCLNRSRASFKEETALLYSVRARGGNLYYNIDETTCYVLAMYEAD